MGAAATALIDYLSNSNSVALSQDTTLNRLTREFVAEVDGSNPGGSGWAVTGTTTLTGDCTIANGTNKVSFTGTGEVGIGGAAVGGTQLKVLGNVSMFGIEGAADESVISINYEAGVTNSWLIKASDDNTGRQAAIVADGRAGTIDINATMGVFTSAGFTVGGGNITAGAAIPAYANNAAAVVGIGTGKLYYTDVAGEYIVKLSH